MDGSTGSGVAIRCLEALLVQVGNGYAQVSIDAFLEVLIVIACIRLWAVVAKSAADQIDHFVAIISIGEEVRGEALREVEIVGDDVHGLQVVGVREAEAVAIDVSSVSIVLKLIPNNFFVGLRLCDFSESHITHSVLHAIELELEGSVHLAGVDYE